MTPFQIKDFVSITAGMVNHMRAVQTDVDDFNVGSPPRTLLEAGAAEIEELYQQMFRGLLQAIPVATYNSFNFARLPAEPAAGLIRVQMAAGQAAAIAAGSSFSSTSAQTNYVSTADVAAAAGGFVDVPVVATSSGSLGNLGAGSTFTPTPAINGASSISNLAPFSSGSDAETDDERKTRFNAYIATLSRATNAAIEYGAKTAALYDSAGNVTEQVQCASVVEPYLTSGIIPPAQIQVYVHNGVGATSAGLVAQADKVLRGYTDASGAKVPGWKAAGVKMTVSAATETAVAYTAVLTPTPGYDPVALIAQAQAALSGYLQGLDIGQPYIHADAIFLVMSVPGVANFVPSTPTADVAAASDHKIVPGLFTLSHP